MAPKSPQAFYRLLGPRYVRHPYKYRIRKGNPTNMEHLTIEGSRDGLLLKIDINPPEGADGDFLDAVMSMAKDDWKLTGISAPAAVASLSRSEASEAVSDWKCPAHADQNLGPGWGGNGIECKVWAPSEPKEDWMKDKISVRDDGTTTRWCKYNSKRAA